jgi:catechol 2,3-dioxygenase-like lactoylglutathione lyase family enzyme
MSATTATDKPATTPAAKSILGIHHVTAIAGDAGRNIDFYTRSLGLRLVKVTVNFDDPTSYHLYYGDASGHPGTLLTFFVWPGARRGRIGNSQVTTSSFAIPRGAAQYWRERLRAHSVEFEVPEERFGDSLIAVPDPDGLRLELIESGLEDRSYVWEGSDVPPDAAIHGFHSTTLSETVYERTARLLTDTMELRMSGNEQNRYRYQVPGVGSAKTIDVVCAPGGVEGHVGVGTVHHIAFRTRNDEEQTAWLGELSRLGYNLSPVMDRVYFHSIYYREPGGILFEIATDPPGFTVDEPLDRLGTTLKLPPWFESHRREIEASLPEIAVLRKEPVK